jgi:hypothetical protein
MRADRVVTKFLVRAQSAWRLKALIRFFKTNKK